MLSYKEFKKKIAQHRFGAGFTLIELLIVIALIGVLAGGIVTVLNPATQTQKANDAKRKSDLHQMRIALEAYYNDNGQYPPGKCDSCSGWSCLTGPLGQYMATIPSDPKNSSPNCYYYSSNVDDITPVALKTPNRYVLATRLEKAPNLPDLNCTVDYYNYCPGNPGTDKGSGVASFYGAISANYVILGP